MTYELLLRGGRIIDPSQNLDLVGDLAFAGGKVAALDRKLEESSALRVRDVSGCLVTPGLIDLHTHVYWGGTSLGVDADELARTSAVTTCVDAGSAGPGNFAGFRRHVIERSAVRIIPYLHISFAGIFGFSAQVMVGESADLHLLSCADALAVARDHRDLIAGIKVRVGFNAGGASGLAPLAMARQVAEAADLPLMVHIDLPPPGLSEVLDLMRKGDILTHAFRPFPNSAATMQGGVEPSVLAARQRGILFDIGHGMGSFSFEVARLMLANAFQPDCISSDVHTLCINGPAYDLLTTMSKFLLLGMPLTSVIRAATQTPALAIRRPELGTLRPGGIGDASIISLRSGDFDLVDSLGVHRQAHERLIAEGTVIAGRWFHP
jgi:dihydroorotase